MYACRLSSEASLWSTQLSSGVGEVWEFLYLAVTSEGTQGGISLHGRISCQFDQQRPPAHMCFTLCTHRVLLADYFSFPVEEHEEWLWDGYGNTEGISPEDQEAWSLIFIAACFPVLQKLPAGVGNPFVTKGCSFGEVLLNRESGGWFVPLLQEVVLAYQYLCTKWLCITFCTGTFEFKAVALSSKYVHFSSVHHTL